MRFTTVADKNEKFRFGGTELKTGKRVDQTDPRFKGKVVLVNLTGSWCPNCHDEAPFLAALDAKYRARGLQIVGLDFEDAEQLSSGTPRLKAFINRYKLNYTYLIAGERKDVNAKLPQAVNLNAWPTSFFVGRDGKVKSVHVGLRPYTAAMWAALDDKERARFSRHLRPYWDVHRHRLAPEAAERLDRWIKTGALRVVAGRLTCADRAQITWRIRGSAETQSVGNAVLINCTGPATGLDALSAPVLADLLLKGECRPDPLGLGLDLTADGAVLDASGVARADIYAIGPLARGAFWESTAVPDLRSHAADLARDLCRRLPLFVPTQKVG